MSTVATPKSLSQLDNTFGYQAPSTTFVGLKDILQELRGLRFSMVMGGAQSTALSLVGGGGAAGAGSRILTTDPVLACYEHTVVSTSGLAAISMRNDIRVLSTGNVQFSGAATTNSFIMVVWWDQSGYIAYA
jgi:hypothetical protein